MLYFNQKKNLRDLQETLRNEYYDLLDEILDRYAGIENKPDTLFSLTRGERNILSKAWSCAFPDEKKNNFYDNLPEDLDRFAGINLYDDNVIERLQDDFDLALEHTASYFIDQDIKRYNSKINESIDDVNDNFEFPGYERGQ